MSATIDARNAAQNSCHIFLANWLAPDPSIDLALRLKVQLWELPALT